MTAPLRIVFLGSDAIALPLLDWIDGPGRGTARVVAVFTQPDRATGRGQKVQPNAIKTWALEREMPVFQPHKLTAVENVELGKLSPDLGLVMAYGHILRDEFINIPRLGMLNLHTSILPKYRGASPIQTAIANGERETGVTLMRIVRRLDAGPAAAVERVHIDSLDTAADVETKLSRAGVPLVQRGLESLQRGELTFVEQEEAAATYCRKLEKTDGVLDFSASAAVLAARINGLFPWPSCSVEISGQPVKFGLADIAPSSSQSTAPGTVTGRDEHGLLIQTGDGILRVRRLQRPGGRMLMAEEFLRGFPIKAGTVLPSRPLTVLVTKK